MTPLILELAYAELSKQRYRHGLSTGSQVRAHTDGANTPRSVARGPSALCGQFSKSLIYYYCQKNTLDAFFTWRCLLAGKTARLCLHGRYFSNITVERMRLAKVPTVGGENICLNSLKPPFTRRLSGWKAALRGSGSSVLLDPFQFCRNKWQASFVRSHLEAPTYGAGRSCITHIA